MSKECPNCRLVNPADAQQCGCGFDFVASSSAPRFDPHPRLTRLAAIETWVAVVIAILAIGYALMPARPMLGLPVQEFAERILPLPPLTIGIGLAIAGIRFGPDQVRGLAKVTLLVLVILLVACTLACLNRYAVL
jgi:hypothetical protein